MNYSENFEDFIYWYTSLVNEQNRRKYFQDIAAHHNGKLLDGLKKINYSDRDRETGEYIERTLDLDKHLYGIAQPFIKKPTLKIIPDISIEDDLPKLLTTLRHSYDEIIKQELQKKYPGYSVAIQQLGKELAKIKKASKPNKSGSTSGRHFGVKTNRARDLEALADKIIQTEDHEEAVNMLEEEFDGFIWNRPRKYFFTQAGKPNISQISHALSLVAKIKWPKNPPSTETIRKALKNN